MKGNWHFKKSFLSVNHGPQSSDVQVFIETVMETELGLGTRARALQMRCPESDKSLKQEVFTGCNMRVNKV